MISSVEKTTPLTCPEYDTANRAPAQKRIEILKNTIFPLTKPFLDQKGNSIQIWSIPDSKAIGILQLPTGSLRFFYKIKNALSPTDNLVTIHNQLLLASEECTWSYVSNEDGSLIIWPHLIAQGWRDALPKANQNLNGLTRLARGKTQEQMCAWFYTNGYKLSKESPSKIEIHLHDHGSAGIYSANDHTTIQNLLRQGGYIKTIYHKEGDVEFKSKN